MLPLVSVSSFAVTEGTVAKREIKKRLDEMLHAATVSGKLITFSYQITVVETDKGQEIVISSVALREHG